MDFLTPGQKIKRLRKMLNMKQHDLQGEKVKRNFISMLENGERGLSKETAKYLAERFNQRAFDIGVKLQVDEAYLLMSQEEEAKQYCLEKLNEAITIQVIESIIDISIKYNLHDVEALAYLKKGEYIFNERLYSKAMTYYVEAIGKYSSLNDKQFEAYLFNKLGLCKLYELHYTEALEFFKKANYLAIINKDLVTQKNSTYNISLCYRKLNRLDDSIEYIDSYLELCNKDIEFTSYVYAKVIKANCYRDKKEFDRAREIYMYLLGCFMNPQDILLAYVYENLGLLFSDTFEYEKAIECLDKSQRIRTDLDITNLSKSLIDKACILMRQKKFNEAQLLINLGIDMAKKYNDSEYELKGYYLLVDIYRETGHIKELEDIYIKILSVAELKKDYREILNITNKLCLIYVKDNNLQKIRGLLERSQKYE